MILYVCYNDKCTNFPKEVEKLCYNKFPLVEVKSFDENDFKERKKAFKVKGGYSAKMTPFMLLTDDNNVFVHAFYSEAKECTLDKLDKALCNCLLYGDQKITVETKSNLTYESSNNKFEQ